jgi:hypothetical protein
MFSVGHVGHLPANRKADGYSSSMIDFGFARHRAETPKEIDGRIFSGGLAPKLAV